jgi:hypothetical protein
MPPATISSTFFRSAADTAMACSLPPRRFSFSLSVRSATRRTLLE